MIAHVYNAWFWVPLAIATAVVIVVGYVAYHSNKGRGARDISEAYFDNPVRNGAIGSALSLLPILVGEDIRGELVSVLLVSAAALLFLISTVLGLWLYSSVQALPRPSAGSVRIDSPVWIVVHGIVLVLQISAACTLIAFVFFGLALGATGNTGSDSSAKDGAAVTKPPNSQGQTKEVPDVEEPTTPSMEGQDGQ